MKNVFMKLFKKDIRGNHKVTVKANKSLQGWRCALCGVGHPEHDYMCPTQTIKRAIADK